MAQPNFSDNFSPSLINEHIHQTMDAIINKMNKMADEIEEMKNDVQAMQEQLLDAEEQYIDDLYYQKYGPNSYLL